MELSSYDEHIGQLLTNGHPGPFIPFPHRGPETAILVKERRGHLVFLPIPSSDLFVLVAPGVIFFSLRWPLAE